MTCDNCNDDQFPAEMVDDKLICTRCKASTGLGESLASLLKSAEAWAAEGLRESKLAGDAVRNQNHCTAENHRKNAALAFECELNLRKLTIPPNDGTQRPRN
jgi:hypothetical protein